MAVARDLFHRGATCNIGVDTAREIAVCIGTMGFAIKPVPNGYQVYKVCVAITTHHNSPTPRFEGGVPIGPIFATLEALNLHLPELMRLNTKLS